DDGVGDFDYVRHASLPAATSPTPTAAGTASKKTTTAMSSGSGTAANSASGRPDEGGLHLRSQAPHLGARGGGGAREVQGRPPSAWVFGYLQNLCQNALHGCGYAVGRICDHHRFLGQEDRLAESLRHQRPELAWVSLAQPGTARGTRNDKRAKRFECRIARAQLEGHRLCVVEAGEGSVVWDMPDILELLDDGRWHMDRPDFKAKGVPALVMQMAAAGCFDGGVRCDAVDVSFADDVDDAGCKVSALTASFPAEQRTRDKARKAADPERKAKKRPQKVEQVFDDCGSDFTKLYVANEYVLDEVCYGAELREDQCIDEQPYVMMSEFFGMTGSEAYLSEKDEQRNFFSSASGPSFDLICDCDLMTHEGQKQFWEYLHHGKPLVLLISTPCASLKGFSALNRVINYSGWLRSRRVSVGLARIAAAAARAQMDAGRHIVSEQPLGSDFYKLDDWRYIANKRGSCPERDQWRLENPKDHAEWAMGICRELATSISRMIERVSARLAGAGARLQTHGMPEYLESAAQTAFFQEQLDLESCDRGNRRHLRQNVDLEQLEQMVLDFDHDWRRLEKRSGLRHLAAPRDQRTALARHLSQNSLLRPQPDELEEWMRGRRWWMIDEATCWTVLNILDRKTAIMIIAGITNGWIRPHGPTKLLSADIEGGLHGEEACQWLIIHRVRSQLEQEGIVMPLEILIAECTLIKNLLITVAGFSPYQAVHGRLPPLFAEFEPVSDCQIDDQSAGIPGISRHHHRLREVAMQAMVEVTVKDRLKRALRSKTRAPHEALQLAVGDKVDFHRPPSTKGESGWRGLAALLQVGPPVLVRWQGRVFQVRPQDFRRSLVYLAMFTNNIFFEAGSRDPVATIVSYADQLDSKVARAGWLFDAGWKRTADSQKLSELVLAVLQVAASGFYLVGCVGAGVGNGVSALEGMVGCDRGFLWRWRRGRPELSWHYEASGSARLKLAQIFGKDHWREVSFVQFILTDDESDPPGLQEEDIDMPWQDREDDDGNDDGDSDSDATQEYEPLIQLASWQYMKEQAALPAVDAERAQRDFFFAAPDADHVAEAIEEGSMNSRLDCVEIGIGAPLMYWVHPEVEYIQRPGVNVLTLEEARAHEVEVRQAMKDQADNVIDSRWVLKWKEIDGKKQGLYDMQSPDLATFAGATTRWGQRLVDQMTAQRKWRLFSADISQAFLRGLTFEQVAAVDGEVKRRAQVAMPPGSIPVLRQLEGYEGYSPVTEVLLLLRCGFGLKHAPRLRQVMLSSHVGDPKGGGEDYLREKCIGVMHEQGPVTKAIWTHQQHYAQ
ncbi:unnamed protein product, partial [Prorocentrum cordatum]